MKVKHSPRFSVLNSLTEENVPRTFPFQEPLALGIKKDNFPSAWLYNFFGVEAVDHFKYAQIRAFFKSHHYGDLLF